MITPVYVQKMATYNAWINESIYAAAGELTEEQRQEDCGAFFKSIHGTLNHLLWGDRVWMHRFAGTPLPDKPAIADSPAQYASFEELKPHRIAMDETITGWAENVEQSWLDSTLDWRSGSTGRDMSSPMSVLVTHMFNHQTHHRGQVHALLTRFGVKTPITDLPFAP